MAANSDMNSPSDVKINTNLNSSSQAGTSLLDSLNSQTIAGDVRKRLPARKADTQNGVKVTFQLPKHLASRLKRVAEKVPNSLSDFGLLSLHFLGERTIQLASTSQSLSQSLSLSRGSVPDMDTREATYDSTCSSTVANNNRDHPRPSLSNDLSNKQHDRANESLTKQSSDELSHFVVPLSNSASLQGSPACSTPGSPALSVALVTSNGLKLRVRTSQMTSPPSQLNGTDSSVSVVATSNKTDRPINGVRQPIEQQQQRACADGSPESDDRPEMLHNGNEVSIDRFDREPHRNGVLVDSELSTPIKAINVPSVRLKRGCEAASPGSGEEAGLVGAVALNGKRLKMTSADAELAHCDSDSSPLPPSTNHHHIHLHSHSTTHTHGLGMAGMLQNGHTIARDCELDPCSSAPSPQNGLALRSSKPLNGVRCVTPRAMHAVSSATGSDL